MIFFNKYSFEMKLFIIYSRKFIIYQLFLIDNGYDYMTMKSSTFSSQWSSRLIMLCPCYTDFFFFLFILIYFLFFECKSWLCSNRVKFKIYCCFTKWNDELICSCLFFNDSMHVTNILLWYSESKRYSFFISGMHYFYIPHGII